MNDLNETHSPSEITELLKQLRAENDALHEQVRSLHNENSRLRGEVSISIEREELLRRQLGELQNQLAFKGTALDRVQAELSTLTDATQVLVEDRKRLREKVEALQASVNRLTNMVWGRRSEKRYGPNDPTLFDMQLSVEELTAEEQRVLAAERQLSDAAKRQALDELLERRRKRRLKRLREGGREQFPAHLQRRETILDLDDEAKRGLVLLRVDVFERLRFEKPQVYVEVIRRSIYVQPDASDAGVIAKPAPLGILPGVKYGFDIIAAAVSMKMSFHQPTYRQQDIFGQSGYFPSRSTINDWLNYSVIVINALFQEAMRLLLLQPILLGDDTQVRLLTRKALSDEELKEISRRASRLSRERSPPGSVVSYVWLYTGLDGMAPYNIFHWSLTREEAWIDTHLANCHGVFVGDAAWMNARLGQRSGGRIAHAACNTHARREFVAAEKNHPREAAKALAFYKRLYAVEAQCKLLPAPERLAFRRRESLPIWDSFREWINSDAMRGILPKSRLGKALTYINNHWEALRRYLNDGCLPIDNNRSEQTIRLFVLEGGTGPSWDIRKRQRDA